MTKQIDYNASRTLSNFHHSDAFYRGIRGPVGSGKSTACCAELWRRANEQEPNNEGIRRTRWVVIRNTYKELEDTTLNTFLDWFGDFGTMNKTRMIFYVDMPGLEIEFLFRPLDRPGDIKKLLSLEVTGGWVNEAKEIPKGIIDTLGDRVGRFPSKKDGAGATWSGVIMDTNPPDDDHWWAAFETRDIELLSRFDIDGSDLGQWEFFIQPGGLIERDGKFLQNPAAENTENLPDDYYADRVSGKKKSHIRVYYCNEFGFVQEGMPVYPEFYQDLHVSKEILEPVPGIKLLLGQDFGLTPAVLIAQQMPNGQYRVIDEIVTENIGTKRFARDLLGPRLRGEYNGYEYKGWGDPAGNIRHETDESYSFAILEAEGIHFSPAADNNNFTPRRESIASLLSRMIDGKPGIIVSPKCRNFIKGMKGGYFFKRVQVSGDAKFRNEPDKNKYSHICEAGQYLFLGNGEGAALIKKASTTPYKKINRKAKAPARRRR